MPILEWGPHVADVFLSYKTERRNAAQHLSRILELNDYSVWFDYRLLSGLDFGPQIERELRAAKAVIVLWCNLSRDSRWVLEEANLAERLGTFTPVWLERVDLPLGFGRTETIDLSNWDGSPRSPVLDRLFNEVARRVGHDPAPSYRSLQNYEQTWRGFGAPPLARFPLVDPIAEEARSFGGRFTAEQSGSGSPVTQTILRGAWAKDWATAPPRPLARRFFVLAGVGGSVAIAGGGAIWYWSLKTQLQNTTARQPIETSLVPPVPGQSPGQPINGPLASFSRSNSDWTVSLSFIEPVTAIAWRLGGTGPFKETGFLNQLDPSTRRRMANSTFELDADQAATTIEVRAVGLDGKTIGPFPIPFDPLIELERDARSILEETVGAWVEFRDWSGASCSSITPIWYRIAARSAKRGLALTAPCQTRCFPWATAI